MNQSQIESFIWGVADLIRDNFKRGKYQDVILPLTVLRRLDCVLAGKKEKVLARRAELRGKGLENPDQQLRRAAGFAFYNTSQYDFERLCDHAPNLAANSGVSSMLARPLTFAWLNSSRCHFSPHTRLEESSAPGSTTFPGQTLTLDFMRLRRPIWHLWLTTTFSMR